MVSAWPSANIAKAIEQAIQTGFIPSEHGFRFSNYFPRGTPALVIRTPFGKLHFGDAGAGLCGGMIFAALDGFHYTTPLPAEADSATCEHLGRRLFHSWNLPFGVLKYYDWQCRPTASKFLHGVRILDGTRRLTIEQEWPKIQALLDMGQPVALGVVQATGFNPRRLVKNHQVIATGYTLTEHTLSLPIYDPNHPGDNALTLTLTLNDPDSDEPFRHSAEGPRVRGLFVTEYQPREFPGA